jgi:cell volume regulation protein A
MTQLVIILAVGIIAREISNKTKFPFVVLLIVFGTLLASLGALDLKLLGGLPDLIRILALIIIVFSAGFHLKLREVQADSRLILSLATLGVFLTLFIISGITFALLSIPLLSAIVLGSLLSGSDTAAIASAETSGKSRVKTILLSESMFNQPLTLILPLVLLDYLVKPEMAWFNIPKFFAMLVVGGVVGVGGAFWGQKILEAGKHKHDEIIGLMIAIGVYVIAENFFGSGIVAVAITSLLLSSAPKRETGLLGKFTEQLAFLFTIFVFIMLGMLFTLSELAILGVSRYEVIAIAVALLVARMVSVSLISLKSDLSFVQRIKLGLISPKGIAPAAMAPLFVAYGITGSDVILKIVYIAIIVSVFISMATFGLGSGQKTVKQQRIEKSEDRLLKKEAVERSKQNRKL